MGLFSKIFGDPDGTVAAYKAADDKLQSIPRSRQETDEWDKANDAMWAAREKVPWWRHL